MVPLWVNARLGGRAGDVDDDEAASVFKLPGPSDETIVARIVRPAGDVATVIFASEEDGIRNGFEKFAVEGLKPGIDALDWTASQEDGDADATAFDLPFMEEDRAGERGHGDSAYLQLRGREGCGGAWFVMIFEEAKQV